MLLVIFDLNMKFNFEEVVIFCNYIRFGLFRSNFMGIFPPFFLLEDQIPKNLEMPKHDDFVGDPHHLGRKDGFHKT